MARYQALNPTEGWRVGGPFPFGCGHRLGARARVLLGACCPQHKSPRTQARRAQSIVACIWLLELAPFVTLVALIAGETPALPLQLDHREPGPGEQQEVDLRHPSVHADERQVRPRPHEAAVGQDCLNRINVLRRGCRLANCQKAWARAAQRAQASLGWACSRGCMASSLVEVCSREGKGRFALMLLRKFQCLSAVHGMVEHIGKRRFRRGKAWYSSLRS